MRASVEPIMRNHPDPAAGDADDMASIAFNKAFVERESIREPEKLLGWLKTTARNAALDRIRVARSRTTRLPTEAIEEVREDESGTTAPSNIDAPSIIASSIIAYRNAAQDEANRELVAELLCLLRDKDLAVTMHILEGRAPAEIAEAIGNTRDAVQKRWERIRKWLGPIAHNLKQLLDCLPEEDDRKIMERYLDNQSLSEISEQLGISSYDIEAVVKRVIKDWKKAANVRLTFTVMATRADFCSVGVGT